MSKLVLASSLLALASSAALAEASIQPPPSPLLTGFYVGLNAGYGFGANSSVNGSLRQLTSGGIVHITGATGFTTLSSSGIGGVQPANIDRSGFIGGGQLGYNYQYGSNIVLGIETDFQGSAISGNQQLSGVSRSPFSGLLTQRGGFVFPATFDQRSYLTYSVGGGVDYLGTLRARVGYLMTPTLLIYGAGGLAYGGVWSSVSTAGGQSTNLTTNLGPYPAANQIFFGGSTKKHSLLAGYAAGGGLEWRATKAVSLKIEALYWDLGALDLAATSLVPPVQGGLFAGQYKLHAGENAIQGDMRLNYQGVVARAGVNYHFNSGGAGPIRVR